MSNLVLKNFSLLTISNFINQFILVFSGIKIARTLGPASYGIYTYLFIQMLIYSTISDLGLRNIIIRTIARNKEMAKSTFFVSITLQLFGLIICSSLMLIYEHFTHSIKPTMIIYVILAVYLTNLWATCESVWQGHQRMGTPAFINVFYSLVWIIFVLLTPTSSFTVEYLFKYYCYSQILQVGTLFICMFLVRGVLIGKITNFVVSGFMILKESSPYYLLNVVNLPTSSLSNNFLERNSTKSELGYFNTSNRLMSPVRLVINLSLSAVFPNISALWINKKQELINKVTVSFPVFVIIFGWICFSFALVSKNIILILFGVKFLPSVPIMQFQIWFIFLYALYCFIGTIWGATDQQRLIAKFGVINSLIATPLLWFGSKYNAIGLVYSYLIVYLILFPFYYYFFVKTLNLKLKMLKELICIIIMFLVSSFIPITTPFWERVVLVVITLAIIIKKYYKLLRIDKKVDINI
ncbi:oligosaccharide flippase family protein [Mucilaginibacter sp.]|uniref:oligosaccharide flippase family protein n=1 Tax=Mucilaginibacter sp. TaxID=1882438 RepID=UPI00283C6EE7|nr:oligosaccharide flippase family protein [Mucilaginibacter sp.]MDR3696336.1 oligosaccharide flippase family protein [Mucilaginibacter sp.]